MAAPSAQFTTDLKVNMTPDSADIRTTSTVNNYGERSFTGGATSYDCYIRRANEAERDMDEVKKIADLIESTLPARHKKGRGERLDI